MKAFLARVAIALGFARGVARARRPVPDPGDGVDPRRRETGAPAWAERTVAGLLVLTGLGLAVFAAGLMAGAGTQLLAGALGGALVALAVALVLAGLRVAPRETAVQERHLGDPPSETARTKRVIADGADGVSRRGLLLGAAGVAGAGAVAAAAAPLTALGPSPAHLDDSPWRAGLRLVDEEDMPLRADELEVGSFATAFPEGAEKRMLASPVVVVRVPADQLALPRGREGWAPEGLLAYSKICTHAGCAVSLYRKPIAEGLSSGPALACPCHYSTFDVRRGAAVIFGPAGRPLPQLPLRIGGDGILRAGGRLSGTVGPAWWGTQRSRT